MGTNKFRKASGFLVVFILLLGSRGFSFSTMVQPNISCTGSSVSRARIVKYKLANNGQETRPTGHDTDTRKVRHHLLLVLEL
jgi:hypothetical protein